LRGSVDATGYTASKAFQWVYWDDLRESVRQKKLRHTVTEFQPGLIDKDMYHAWIRA